MPLWHVKLASLPKVLSHIGQFCLGTNEVLQQCFKQVRLSDVPVAMLSQYSIRLSMVRDVQIIELYHKQEH